MPSDKLNSTENRIYVALIALLRHGADDSFLVIEEPLSQKFVQFGKGRCLGMDVPLVNLSREEADDASRFFEKLGEECPREYHAPDPKSGKVRHGATFHHDFGEDADLAARAAFSFFRDVYRFPPEVPLSIRRLPNN
jgi:hypothetical protein